MVKAKIKDCISDDDIKSLKFTEKHLINKVFIFFFQIISAQLTTERFVILLCALFLANICSFISLNLLVISSFL